MKPPAPCWRCGALGARDIGTRGYCGTHLAELLSTFDSALWTFNGIGLPNGRLRPEYGPTIEELRCTACAATWCGTAGDRCEWCRAHREHLTAHQRAVLLAVPDLSDTAEVDVVLTAWGDRLKRGVSAGILTRAEAERAWRRAVRDVAA